jgi:transposase
MASAHMPEAFWNFAEPLLPPEQPVGPRGGRPRVPNRVILRVIWFILATGNRWCDVPKEMGSSGETARTRLAEWQRLGVWDQIHLQLLTWLQRDQGLEHQTVIIDSGQVRAMGAGENTGPSPVDRAKPGTKYTIMVDAQGIPLAASVAGSNASDKKQLLPIVQEQFPEIGGRSGRPRTKPQVAVADAGYDSEPTRNALRSEGIEPLIRKAGTKHGSGLGQVRWVVERTISWLKGLRRLRIRYDRSVAILCAFVALAMAIINFGIWQDCHAA